MNKGLLKTTPIDGAPLLSASDLPTPRRFLLVAFVALGCLVALSALGLVLAAAFDNRAVRIFHKAFDLDQERNVATLANFTLHILNLGLSGLIARRALAGGERFRWHWAMLVPIFLLLGFDEAASLHEKLIYPLRALLGTSGIFYFAWIVPGIAVVLTFVLAYLGFLLSMPGAIRATMILAGVIFVSGAIGTEMVGGVIASHDTLGESAAYQITTAIEETLEMTGLIVFASALIAYLRRPA